jgi:mannosyl-oligosaccharide alpha-1,2-mannosidase
MVSGLLYLFLHKGSEDIVSSELHGKEVQNKNARRAPNIRTFWRKPPRLPPRLPPNEIYKNNSLLQQSPSEWTSRQKKVKEAFEYAWSGYQKYAMGYDELMPLSHRGTDGLGGLGATIVDSLDTAIIMGADDVVSEASKWIEDNLMKRISEKGQVNLFETTIRVLGGLLSAYHLSGGDHPGAGDSGVPVTYKKANPERLLEVSKDLANRLLLAFTSSPTAIPLSDVILRDHTAHAAPDGLSSTSEASTLQLEFSYLSKVSGDPKYDRAAMKVLEHMHTLPKVEGLVPIYIKYACSTFVYFSTNSS